jgi:hypothetical protein
MFQILATRTFTQMLEATSEEFQTFMEKKQSAFVNQMKGNNQIDHSETIKELKSKLQEKSEQVCAVLYHIFIFFYF